MNEEKRHPSLPDVQARYLLDWFLDVGPAMGGGFSPAPLTYSEIRHWQDSMGLCIAPHEAQALRDMSRAYVDQAARSDDPQCPPPYRVFSRRSRAQVADALDEALGAKK